MAVVAVAGGTGNLGKAIVEEIRRDGKHPVKILSRKPVLDGKDQDEDVIFIDYDNIGSMTKTLEEHNIHTVLSVISVKNEAQTQAQLNLIKAADKSSTTKRFAPSEWSFTYNQEQAATVPAISGKLQAHEELKQSSLEFSLFSPGWFLDYYGIPYVKSYLQPFPFVVDVANKAAGIPGSGDATVTFTHTFDVAKFVAASLDLEQWPERSYIIGDKATWNEVVTIAEETRGQKFDIEYDSIEKLKSAKITELPGHREMYEFFPKEELQSVLSSFSLWSAAGAFDIPDNDTLNMKFPYIKPMSIKELLDTAWKGR